MSKDIAPSARIYVPFFLHLYDIVVLTLVNNYAWRCSTTSVLLPFFQQHVGEHAHLDVGVGTGYYLAASAAQLSKTKNVTIADLNPHTLDVAAARLKVAGYRGTIDSLQHDVFRPFPDEMRGRFDSISIFYLLHCLPGRFPLKGSHVFANLAPGLAPGGVLYGATVTGKSRHSWFSGMLQWYLNRVGIFGNAEDTYEALADALRSAFEEVEIREVGVVAIFEARKPLRRE